MHTQFGKKASKEENTWDTLK